MLPMRQWHCVVSGQQYGPLSEDVLQKWAREGRIGAGDMVWTEGMEQWVPLQSVPELAAAADSRWRGPMPGQLSASPESTGRGMAVAGMILGIVGLSLFCALAAAVPCGILACVFGGMAIKKYRVSGGNRRKAMAGIICGAIAIAVSILLQLVLLMVSFAPLFRHPGLE